MWARVSQRTSTVFALPALAFRKGSASAAPREDDRQVPNVSVA